MDVFAFRKELISEYERFSRSFTRIRAADILQGGVEVYAGGPFWPAPFTGGARACGLDGAGAPG